MSGKNSISNNDDIGAAINGENSIDHTPPPTTTKSEAYLHERRIVSNAKFLPDENKPIIMMKTRLLSWWTEPLALKKTIFIGRCGTSKILPWSFACIFRLLKTVPGRWKHPLWSLCEATVASATVARVWPFPSPALTDQQRSKLLIRLNDFVKSSLLSKQGIFLKMSIIVFNFVFQ